MKNTAAIRGWLRNLFCGVLIGMGAIVPGVSGGILAVIFGIYRPLMEILSDPLHKLPQYWKWLLPVAVGWMVGFLGFARGIAVVMERDSAAAAWLFLGLILGTLPQLFREAGKKGRSRGSFASFFICAGLLAVGVFAVNHSMSLHTELNFWWYSFCGFLWGMSVVIPGLSTASLMMALGLYQPMMEKLSQFDFFTLAAVIPGMLLAIAALSRLVNFLFRRFYSQMYHGILGIVAASVVTAVPTTYSGGMPEIIWSVVFGTGGFILAFFLDRLDQRMDKNS